MIPAQRASLPPLVDTDWLQETLGESDLRVLDCSVTKVDYDDGSYGFVPGRPDFERGHVPGSVFVDVLQELSDRDNPLPLMMPPADRFAAIMAGYGVGDGTRVVIYDRGNHAWAARVWWMLRVIGFDNAAVLNGGFRKWATEDRPVTTDAVSYPPARFTVSHRPGLMASKQDVLDALKREATCLIHALPPAVFSGAVQIFPRPGRIPRSWNVYCDSLIDPQTLTFREPAALRELFAASGALHADRVITYCGGGIAASSDALTLVLLGHDDVAVYDGSMSEWTADPDTPLEL